MLGFLLIASGALCAVVVRGVAKSVVCGRRLRPCDEEEKGKESLERLCCEEETGEREKVTRSCGERSERGEKIDEEPNVVVDFESLNSFEVMIHLEGALRRMPFEDESGRASENVEEFLNAMMLVVQLLKVFMAGNPAGMFVMRDISNHVKTVRCVNAECAKTSVQELVYAERRLGREDATRAMLFMKRGLNFTVLLIAHMTSAANVDKTVADSARAAYQVVYAAVHPRLLRPTVRFVLNATPKKRVLYEKLQPPNRAPESAAARNALRRIVRAGAQPVSSLAAFFRSENLETKPSLAPDLVELRTSSDSELSDCD